MPGQRTEMTSAYGELLASIVGLLEEGRPVAARSVNVALTMYWLVRQRLVEHDQRGEPRATNGTELLKRLSRDLQARLGRGLSERNLEQMRQFYLQWPNPQTASADSGSRGQMPGLARWEAGAHRALTYGREEQRRSR